MTVNAKEKKALNRMWEGTPDEPEGDLPDGKYQFEITEAEFEMSGTGKPRIASLLKVVGGEEELLDEEIKIYDNLETQDNMGWFKRKLKRLCIDIPEDFSDIADGTVTGAMEGTVFEGQVKTKDGFLNVYVNKLISSKDGEKEGEEEEEENAEEAGEELEVGDEVTFTFKGEEHTGEVLEIFEDDEKARVKSDSTGKVYKVKLDNIKIQYDENPDKEGEEEGEEETGEDDDEFPTPKELSAMKKKSLADFIESVGLNVDEISSKKDVLPIAVTISKVRAGDESTKEALTKVLKAYGRKVNSRDKVSKLVASVKAEVDAALL